MIKVLLLPLVPLALLSSFSPSDIKTSEDLLQAMHNRYTSRWYKTLTFVQATKRYQPDSTLLTSTCYEAFSFPGSMRIDMDSIRYNGVIFSRDAQYVFREDVHVLRITEWVAFSNSGTVHRNFPC
jgi:hypothetical protein